MIFDNPLSQVSNEGSPTIEAVQMSVLYPVTFNTDEMVYLAEIASSAQLFNCTEATTSAVNSRSLLDIFSEDTEMRGKWASIETLPCGEGWQCLNITCTLHNIKPGNNKAVKLAIKTYINAEAASMYPNITFPIAYSASVLDARSLVSPARVTWGNLTTVVEVLPGEVNVLWYIAAAVAGGSVLLVGMVVGLVKCGFFKRERRDEVKLMSAVAGQAAGMVTAVVGKPGVE